MKWGKMATSQAGAARQFRPVTPTFQMIASVLGGSLFWIAMALFLWLPSRSLVHDLRSNGVTIAATVTGVDNKPRYVRVEFLQGTRAGTETELWDYAGMLPDVHPGDSINVTYDATNPSRALPHVWVMDPPTNLPAYACSALGGLFLAGAAVGTVRRRRLLRDPLIPSSPPEQA